MVYCVLEPFDYSRLDSTVVRQIADCDCGGDHRHVLTVLGLGHGNIPTLALAETLGRPSDRVTTFGRRFRPELGGMPAGMGAYIGRLVIPSRVPGICRRWKAPTAEIVNALEQAEPDGLLGAHLRSEPYVNEYLTAFTDVTVTHSEELYGVAVNISTMHLDDLSMASAKAYIEKYNADQLARAWRATASVSLLRELAVRISAATAQVHLEDPLQWAQEDLTTAFVILRAAGVKMNATTAQRPPYNVRQLEFFTESGDESVTEVSESVPASDSESPSPIRGSRLNRDTDAERAAHNVKRRRRRRQHRERYNAKARGAKRVRRE
jgi:hypothetical protein